MKYSSKQIIDWGNIYILFDEEVWFFNNKNLESHTCAI